MKKQPRKDIRRIFREEGHLIDEALKKGVREAVVQHKRDRLPMVVETDGKSEWVKPEDLPNA